MKPSNLSCKSNETFSLVILMLSSRICTNLPLIFTRSAGTAAPISSLISGLAAILLVYFFTKKFYASKGGNIIDKANKIWGDAGKYILSFVIISYLFVSSAYMLGQFSAFSKKLAFPTSPLWFVAIFFALAALCGAFGGIKGLMRITRIAVWGFIGVFLLLNISILLNCNFSNLFPIVGNGLPSTLQSGFSGILLYADMVLVFLINPFSHSPKSTGHMLLWGTVFAVAINLLLILTFTVKIPYPLSNEEQFPLYVLSKEIYFGRFFQRIDAILLLSSSLFNMLRLAFNLALIGKIFSQSFNVSSRTLTLIPSILIIYLFVSGVTILSPEFFEKILIYLGFALTTIPFLAALFVRKETVNDNEI